MNFATQQSAWSNPPVDDVGYISSEHLNSLSDEALRSIINAMEKVRYYGWRNYDDNWRRVLRLDDTVGCSVLDYGCGVGVEALQYARSENLVSLADIVPDNLELAQKVLRLYGYKAKKCYVIDEHAPFIGIKSETFDVIHCAGVLHHIPNAVDVVEAMSSWLTDNGELRLMLYSDEAWRGVTGTDPPDEVLTHPNFNEYVTTMDGVGEYADWYDYERLQDRFGLWFEIASCEYLTKNRAYLGAVLRKR